MVASLCAGAGAPVESRNSETRSGPPSSGLGREPALVEIAAWVTAGVVTQDMTPGAWHARGACGAAAEVFGGRNPAKAKAVCADCPVKQMCLAYAVVADEREGVWGEHTAAERRRITHLPVPDTELLVEVPRGERRRARAAAESFDARVAALREQGVGLRQIAETLGVGVTDVRTSRRRTSKASTARR